MNFGQETAFGFGATGGGGGGGGVTGANNGLSVVGGTTVQLGQTIGAGGNPATMLHSSEIPMATFSLNLNNGVLNVVGVPDNGSGSDLVGAFNVTRNGSNIGTVATFTGDHSPEIHIITTASVGTGFSSIQYYEGSTLKGAAGYDGPFNKIFIVDGRDVEEATIEFNGLPFVNILNKNAPSGSFPISQFIISNVSGWTNDNVNDLQVYGNAVIDSSHNAGTDDTFSVFAQGMGFSTTDFIIDYLGITTLNSTYSQSNGGQFQGFFNLDQNINFNSGSESQQAFNSNVNVNWNNNTLGDIGVIAFNEVQLQLNMNAAGDPNPAQITINSPSSAYGAGWWVYRGMNPAGSDGTGKLVINSSGDQTSQFRQVPLGAFAARTDFDNGNTVTVTGMMASYVSDLCIAFNGSLDTFIDYSAGGGFNNTTGGFTLTKRIAFWAQDLTTEQGTTTGYAFYSEGPNDLSYLAGKLIIGGANPPTDNGHSLQVNANGSDGTVISLTGAGSGASNAIYFIDSTSTLQNWFIEAATSDVTGTGFTIQKLSGGEGALFITDAGVFNYRGRNAFPGDGNDFNIGGSIEAFLQLVGDTSPGWSAVTGTNVTTYDTTSQSGGGVISTGGFFVDSSSKSAGTPTLISIGVHGVSAGTADQNFSAVFENANVQIAGAGNFASLVDNGAALQVQGAISVTGGMFNSAAQTAVNGATSGTATFSQPEQGSSYKLVVIYCAALLGAAAYVFPTAFAHTPNIVTTNGPASGVVSAISASGVTVTGVTTTGFIILEGF